MHSSQQSHGLVRAGWDLPIEFRGYVLLVLVAALAFLLYTSLTPREKPAEARFVGYRSFWEPTLLLRLRFCTRALPIVTEGYNNVMTFNASFPFTSQYQPDHSAPV